MIALLVVWSHKCNKNIEKLILMANQKIRKQINKKIKENIKFFGTAS